MKKKMLVLLVVLLLVVSTVQVAFAAPDGPDPPNAPPTDGSCHMAVSWWEPDTGPGNAKGVEPGERGMYHVHNKDQAYGKPPYGAHHMDLIFAAHCLVP